MFAAGLQTQELFTDSPGPVSASTHHILGDINPATWGNIHTYSHTMERLRGEVNAMPATRTVWLVHHAFLNRPDLRFFVRQCPITQCRADSLATIVILRVFVCDTHASKGVITIRAGVTETTMVHIPTMETRAIRESGVPAIEIQATDRAVVVDLVK